MYFKIELDLIIKKDNMTFYACMGLKLAMQGVCSRHVLLLLQVQTNNYTEKFLSSSPKTPNLITILLWILDLLEIVSSLITQEGADK